MTSLTFGVLPSLETFRASFEAQCPNGYHVALNGRDSGILDWTGCDVPSVGEWTCEETYNTLVKLTECWDLGDPYASDYAGDLASTILTTLGFEWI